MQAAALPRQKYQVILPLTTIKDNEVYAPNYKDGETVALIRYPHGGTFEIPILKVNNKLAEGKSVLGNTPADAIGINKKNADRLSGADFDGDTVMVIPCNSTKSKVKITSTSPLKGLEGFDTKDAYGGTVKKDADGVDHYYRNGKEYKIMRNTQTEMGKVSNLITDMTLKGATQDELARAVRHSMVVIDAEKHKLDYKQSEIDNGIASLKKKYQGNVDSEGRYHEGASTLISRAKSETQVLKRKGSPTINEDGSLSYKSVKEEYVDKNGKIQVRTQKSTKMAETKDARTLSSGTPQEEAYADYANSMKSLANQARREMMSTGKIAYSASAKATYSEEVNSLNAKLDLALANAPRERQAQTMANATVAAKRKDNPDMTKAEVKKASQQALAQATPASNPMKPTMVKTNDRWQYPLAYIYVGAGVTSIRQANITNCVGTSECPFVTAPLDKVEIDDLIAQWQDQWKEFYEKQTTDMEETNKFWKEQWSTWFLAQTEEIQSAYLTWEAQWNLWYSEHTADMEATSTYWKEKWEAWFNEYTSINTAEMADWKQKSETEFREWFDQLQALLDGNTAASLAKKLLELQEQVDILNQFSSNLENEYTVYQKLYDNGYRTYGDVLDSSDAPITDSNLDTVIGRTYSSDLLRDSNGDVIEGRAIFVIK